MIIQVYDAVTSEVIESYQFATIAEATKRLSDKYQDIFSPDGIKIEVELDENWEGEIKFLNQHTRKRVSESLYIYPLRLKD